MLVTNKWRRKRSQETGPKIATRQRAVQAGGLVAGCLGLRGAGCGTLCFKTGPIPGRQGELGILGPGELRESHVESRPQIQNSGTKREERVF